MNPKTSLFLILFAIFFSCQQKETIHYPSFAKMQDPDKGKKAIIQGKILHPEIYPHITFVKLTVHDFDGVQTELITPIDSAGLFRLELYPLVTREITLNPIEDVIVISPGDSLFIEKDFAQISNSVFGGTNAVLNQQISNFRNQYLGRYNFEYEIPYMDFKKACDRQKEDTYRKLKAFSKEQNTSEAFGKWAKKQIELDYYKALFDFPFQHYLRTKEEFSDQKAYYTFLREMEKHIDDSFIMADYFLVADYFGMMKIYGEDLLVNEKRSELIKTQEEQLQALPHSSNNRFLSEFVTASFLNHELKANKTNLMDANMESVNELISHPFLRSSIQNRYNKVKTYNANPRMYSDAVMGNNTIEVNGIGLQISDSVHIIKHIANENAGAILYVDVYAPWCKGCIDDFPHSKKLSDYFEGKPVKFVYLCMGGNTETWKKTIEKYKLTGIHHFCDDNEWRDLMKRFNIKLIPYFLLFNQQGVLIDFGTHLHPDLPETKHAIEELLKKPAKTN